MNWLKVGTGVASAILFAFMIYGDYKYYLCKPVPIVNNTIVQSGGKVEVKQSEQPKSGIAGHLMTGIYGNRSEIGLSAGWIW